MPDNSAKAKRATAADRMAALAAAPEAEATAQRAERSSKANTERRRKAPATTARTIRASAPMPPETPKPRKLYERFSHQLPLDQLEALEEIARAAYRANPDLGKVPLTALLRAATAICLDDARLRDRMTRQARTEWR